MELFIGTQYARFWRRHSKDNLDEDAHKKIGFITFSKAATKRDSKIACSHSVEKVVASKPVACETEFSKHE